MAVTTCWQMEANAFLALSASLDVLAQNRLFIWNNHAPLWLSQQLKETLNVTLCVSPPSVLNCFSLFSISKPKCLADSKQTILLFTTDSAIAHLCYVYFFFVLFCHWFFFSYLFCKGNYQNWVGWEPLGYFTGHGYKVVWLYWTI